MRKQINDHVTLILLDSMEEIKCFFEKYQSKYMWYRGVSNTSYRLIPKAYRNIEPFADQCGRSIEGFIPSASGTQYLLHNYTGMLKKFKAILKDKVPSTIKSNFDWMFLAQHFGLATPLLDWTEDYRVALWFASDCPSRIFKPDEITYGEDHLSHYEFSKNYIAVYQMSPVKFNRMFIGEKCLENPIDVDTHMEYMETYYLPSSPYQEYSPACLKGKWELDNRLLHQKGHFTIHGTNIWALDYYIISKRIIKKILIPVYLLDGIHNFLDNEGITQQYIYQGEDMKDEITKKLNKDEFKLYEITLKELKKIAKEEDDLW